MFKSFNIDRKFIEGKYHKVDEPFNPYKRKAYHGWDCPESTGLSVDDIKNGLVQIAEEYKNQSHEVRKARAIEYVLKNTRIDISEHDYFPLLYTWNREIGATTIIKWKAEMFNTLIPEITPIYKLFNESGAVAMWPDFDHVIPDWNSVLSLGFVGLKDRAAAYRDKLLKEQGSLTKEQSAYFDGIEIEYGAIISFVDRLYKLSLEKKNDKAELMQKGLLALSKGAPTNIYEAMLLMYLYFMISESVDWYQVRSLGNGLDCSLLPFYENDLKNGTFTREEMKELLAYFMMQWSAIGNYWGQPFYLGGSDKNGKTKVNNLTRDIIDVYSELGIYNPKIQIKYNDNIPLDLLNKILSNIRQNKGSYVFSCEPGMIKAIMSYGASWEEAQDFDIRGCYETGVRANEVSTASAYVNVLKAVEYAFSEGFDKRIGKQVGVKTPEIKNTTTFEEFYNIFIAQWSYLIETSIDISKQFEQYLSYVNPSSMYSATIEYSLKQGKDAYQSGVKFNNSAILNCGFASAVDAIMAVYELIFEKQITNFEELKSALDNNWVGYEKLLIKAKRCVHKYGNGDTLADCYAEVLARYYAMKVGNRPNARGGVYKPIMHTAMQFVWQGEKTLATPDGRKTGEEMSKNASPSIGADRNGATALLASAIKLNPTSYTESFCIDVMLHPTAVQGEDGLIAMKGLLDVYLKNDGMSLQFNVFNADTLRDAQANPEKYENLQVRVCGWNVLWNNLPKEQQDAYIARAENII
jgi:formate C-acetyltransferase